MTHPFDRYAPFTDVETLKEMSMKPLRKSMRVNTLKSSIEEFRAYAKEKNWQLQPVPWCSEGFFVEQEERALGKDLFHQLGNAYMQEAASMLPAALLDPQSGEHILDMAAAPGSKTTQIAAQMNNCGVIVANDIQEKRLWTLKLALQRSGIVNTIVTKKNGAWFGKHMTERFDRVLCDAPCSAQGVLRKDPNALKYGSDKRVNVLSGKQKLLLRNAIDAAKIGGRIVYSTCTLTPEENEEVVLCTLQEYKGCIELNAPIDLPSALDASKAVHNTKHPMYRLWPQTEDTEGFFCAVFTKTARTKDPLLFPPLPFQEQPLTPRRQRDIALALEEHFGTTFLDTDDVLFTIADQVVLANTACAHFPLPVTNYSLGLPFAKGLRDSKEMRLAHDLISARGNRASKHIKDIDDTLLQEALAGSDLPCEADFYGETILRWHNLPLGLCHAKDGILKNRLPRRFLQQVV